MIAAQLTSPMPEAGILRAWSEGRGRSDPDRAMAILVAALPEVPRASLESWSLGARDQLLLDLRSITFGDRVEAVAECPSCGERLEVVFDVTEIAGEESQPDEPGAARIQVEVTDGSAGYRVSLRPPTTADLRLAAGAMDVGEGRRRLVDRCVLVAERDGSRIPSSELPDPVIEEMGRAVAANDPRSDVRLAVSCPGCESRWEAPFDIAAFLWEEIRRYARRLLGEVHTLAEAYGWTERDILALPGSRRQAYLELVLG